MALDISEGADIVMIKPAMMYQDIILKIKSEFACPVFAFQVSGEYAMLKAAANAGYLCHKEYASHLTHQLQLAADYGFDVAVESHDWKSLKEKRDAYIKRLNKIYETNLNKRNIYLTGIIW